MEQSQTEPGENDRLAEIIPFPVLPRRPRARAVMVALRTMTEWWTRPARSFETHDQQAAISRRLTDR